MDAARRGAEAGTEKVASDNFANVVWVTAVEWDRTWLSRHQSGWLSGHHENMGRGKRRAPYRSTYGQLFLRPRDGLSRSMPV